MCQGLHENVRADFSGRWWVKHSSPTLLWSSGLVVISCPSLQSFSSSWYGLCIIFGSEPVGAVKYEREGGRSWETVALKFPTLGRLLSFLLLVVGHTQAPPVLPAPSHWPSTAATSVRLAGRAAVHGIPSGVLGWHSAPCDSWSSRSIPSGGQSRLCNPTEVACICGLHQRSVRRQT